MSSQDTRKMWNLALIVAIITTFKIAYGIIWVDSSNKVMDIGCEYKKEETLKS